jgi:cytidylate kinase
MSVITISRGSFSGGKMLAECLAKELGYRCVDRDAVVEKAAAAGISQQELRKALEKPPSFWDRLRHKRYAYLAVMQAALAEEVREGKIVYQGHAGHLLLKGGPVVFRARIIAPLEMRISMAERRLELGRNEVISYIEKVDEERKRWARFLYGVDWTDASLYDVVLNLEHITLARACEIIATSVRGQQCFQFGLECRRAMDDFAIASQVKANLALGPATRSLELEVEVSDGEAKIFGRLSDVHQVDEIERIALAVKGVERVNLEGITSVVPA